MFKETPVVNETETIIGPSVKVEGDFVTEGNIIVEGTICGTIKTAKNLRIGTKSRIFANITAENALIAGEVQGNIKVRNKLELTSTAKIFGDIKAEVLVISPGCAFNGKCQMSSEKAKSPRPDFSRQEKIEFKGNQSETEEIETPATPEEKTDNPTTKQTKKVK
ncbi:MAG: polymer-forming cytoskeletal protein [bacterium]